jgi:hypothetical protein
MAYIDPITVSPGDIGNAAEWNTYIRDNFKALSRDAAQTRHIGASPFECWYVLGEQPGVAGGGGIYSAVNLSNDSLFAIPFVSPRAATIDRLAFWVTLAGGSTSLARVGIYDSTSATNIYPNALVVDAGEQNCQSTGLKSANVDVTLEPDRLYWAVYLEGGTSGTHQIYRSTRFLDVLGIVTTTNPSSAATNLFIAQAYGALPSTFPASAAKSATDSAQILARYSA